MASVSPVNLRQSFITRLNSVVSVTMWSLGETTILALGSTAFIRQLTYAMHGAVFRRQGSQSIWFSGSSGNCFFTMSTYFLLVTIHVLSISQMPLKRSTVICKRDLPTPNTSMNCLGISSVLIGQNLLPTPPAIITKWFIICAIIIRYLHNVQKY